MIEISPPDTHGAIPRAELTGTQRAEMFALLERHFEGTTRDQFETDLAEKNWVIQLRRGDRLVGFTSLLATTMPGENGSLTAIYSGDTIVAPEAWGTPALSRAWISTVNQLRAQFPPRPCYWLLLTSGYRTYRFLPVFWREFFPRRGVLTPPHHQRLLDHLARDRYGENYDAATGLVRFPRPQRLRAPLAAIPAGRLENPDVHFFLTRNPGHATGDELVCLTEISEENLTPAGRRMVAAPCP